MDCLERRYKKDPNMVFRDIEGEMILVPIRRRTADLESIYTLNETGSRIWELIDGQHTLREIRDVIAQEYEVTPRMQRPIWLSSWHTWKRLRLWRRQRRNRLTSF